MSEQCKTHLHYGAMFALSNPVERKYRLIKNSISRNIDAPVRNIETLEPLVRVTIAKEHTFGGSKLKFMRIVWAKIRSTGKTKKLKN
jgi:hypothetical protein